MSESKFKNHYPYKFRVVSYPEFEDAIIHPKDDLVLFYRSELIFTVNGRSVVIGALGPGDAGMFYYDKNLTIKDKTVEFLIKRIDWSSQKLSTR